jgi:hypothetical protein|tara:strand:+ start:5039 stop:5311 length:273 start_codon:yes stop_codon:yes gene_type:complete
MTLDKINIEEYSEETKNIARQLNTPTSGDESRESIAIAIKDNSVMIGLCSHDDGFLCEHRLKWILDKFEKAYTPSTAREDKIKEDFEGEF